MKSPSVSMISPRPSTWSSRSTPIGFWLSSPKPAMMTPEMIAPGLPSLWTRRISVFAKMPVVWIGDWAERARPSPTSMVWIELA